jgi:predicted TPR repeat methyltransferase
MRAQPTRRHQKARHFFDDLWKQGDPWELETAQFERQRYEQQLRLIADRHYPRALEIGCGAGEFTRPLSKLANRVVALDVAPAAIARAHERCSRSPAIDFRVANVMEYDPTTEGPWDLVILSETIYYLGWLYSFFDVAWLASQLFAATRVGGRLLLANTEGCVDDYLVRPWLIRTYRDLFVNVGYKVATEEIYRGTKHGVELEVLMSLFTKTREV